jgi:hypothetical protein
MEYGQAKTSYKQLQLHLHWPMSTKYINSLDCSTSLGHTFAISLSQIQTFNVATVNHQIGTTHFKQLGIWQPKNNMKATTRAEVIDHNCKGQEHRHQVGQQIWLDEHNFLSKKQKLVPNWAGPFVIIKVRDNCNIRIKLERKEININLNRIKPFVAFDSNENTSTPQQHPQQQQPNYETEQPWIQVHRKIQKSNNSKTREGKPKKN